MKPAPRGWLLSLEGGEGAGKSTVVEAIQARLRQLSREVIVVREPGGTDAGEALRRLVLDPALTLSARAELLVMFAARAQLVEERIRPALARGAIVLSDRFTDASFAYQGGGRGIDRACIAELERVFVGLRPDLSLLLDVDVAVGLARVRGRGVDVDRIELERDAFFERVRAEYRQRARDEPERYVLVDAAQDEDRVRADVVAAVERWIERGPGVERWA